MIDKFLAWLNVNINIFSDAAKNHRTSHLQRRKARYKRDILILARKIYCESKDIDL